MDVNSIFLSINARDFKGQSDWWQRLLERRWDREPTPRCHEWDLMGGVLLQVLDNPDGARTAVSLKISDLDVHVRRLRDAGVQVAEPAKVQGFDTLRYATFSDPENNPVGLLEGY